jgi:hypothetical protein
MTTQLTPLWPMFTRRGAERFQPGDLAGLIARPQIHVQPVLYDLALGNAQEEQIRDDATFGLLRRFEDYPVRLGRAQPAEH